jgi:hypothetical protein
VRSSFASAIVRNNYVPEKQASLKLQRQSLSFAFASAVAPAAAAACTMRGVGEQPRDDRVVGNYAAETTRSDSQLSHALSIA